MDRVWIVSHERFRQDNESYNVIAAFETEREASAAMKQYGFDILMNEYYNKCKYDYMYDSELLISEINSKKYPKTTLVIEQAFNKVYIPLKFFDNQTIRALVDELQNVKVYA